MDNEKDNKNRKLHLDGFHWQVNNNWIKEQMVKLYASYIRKDDMTRKLHIEKSMSHNFPDTVGCYFFALQGSPPKGYAIYILHSKKFIFIDSWGEVIRKHKNIIWERG